jgi:hypothetical protein
VLYVPHGSILHGGLLPHVNLNNGIVNGADGTYVGIGFVNANKEIAVIGEARSSNMRKPSNILDVFMLLIFPLLNIYLNVFYLLIYIKNQRFHVLGYRE